MFVYFHVWTAIFKSPITISMEFKLELWLGQCITLHFFFLSHTLVNLLVYLDLLLYWNNALHSHQPHRCRIHSWLNDCKLPRPWSSKASPNHNMFNTMHHSWGKILLLKSCLQFESKISTVTVAKNSLIHQFTAHCFRRPGFWLNIQRYTRVLVWILLQNYSL